MSLALTTRLGGKFRLTLPDGRYVWIGVEPHRSGNTREVKLWFDAPADVIIAREELLPESEKHE